MGVQMKKGRTKNWRIVLAVSASMALVSTGALGDELTSVISYVDQFNQYGAGVTCVLRNPNDPEQVRQFNNCQQCGKALSDEQTALHNKVGGAIGTSETANGAGAAAVGAVTKAGLATNIQSGDESTQNGNGSAASPAEAVKASSAKDASAAFNECANKLRSSCNDIGQSQTNADNDAKACQAGAQHSDQIAAEKAGNGMNMGQLAQLAGAAAQGLGALAGMMNQQPSGVSTDPTTPDVTPPAAADLSGGSTAPAAVALNPAGANGASIDNGSGAATGFTTTAASGTPPEVAASLGGTDASGAGLDSSDGSAAYGSASPAGSGGFGGSSGTNTTGASMMGDASKKAAADVAGSGDYDVNLAGGGSSSTKPFLGLKSDPGDLAGLAGGDVAGDLPADGSNATADDGRQLASAAGSDIHAEEGNSLFQSVHTKYSEMKKRGSI
jgi:hypothetical protein